MQVHVVTKANEHLYQDELEQFFRARHQIYADGLERDQFDIPQAHYLLGVIDGQVITGSRFTPTHLPHTLSEVFPHLCTLNGGIIHDATVAEWTRAFVIAKYREGFGVRLKAQFCHAVMDYMIDEGVTKIGGIQDTFWLSLWRRFRWDVSIHGEPRMFGDRPWLAAYFPVSDTAREGAGKWGKVSAGQSLLVRRGPRRPFIEHRHFDDDLTAYPE